MIDLNKILKDLEAVSRGDVGTLSRATEQFTRDITQANRTPPEPRPATEAPATEPAPKPDHQQGPKV